jgi:hypothetical protein
VVPLTSLREKLIKIGAKVVSHGRYVTFQLAEVSVSRQMFAEILSLIARLRGVSCPSMKTSGVEWHGPRRERCALVKAISQVPTLRGGQFPAFSSKSMRRGLRLLCRRPKNRTIVRTDTGIRRMSVK